MLRAFQIPIGWGDLARRTAREVVADNCLNLAAQLAYYFFLALFPALLFLVAIVSFIPVEGLLDSITSTLARVAPNDVISIVQDQILKIAHETRHRPPLLLRPRRRTAVGLHHARLGARDAALDPHFAGVQGLRHAFRLV